MFLEKELIVGRRAIVKHFKDLNLISNTLSQKDAWHTIWRWRKKYSIQAMFISLPNGKPAIMRFELNLFIHYYVAEVRKDESGHAIERQKLADRFNGKNKDGTLKVKREKAVTLPTR